MNEKMLTTTLMSMEVRTVACSAILKMGAVMYNNIY